MKGTVLKSRQNYNAIDLTRFICAILVIMLHVPPFGVTDSGTVYHYLNFGIRQYAARTAVPFFFIAAGFFLFRKTSPESFDTGIIKKYVIRVLRLYLIWTVIYLPISAYRIYESGQGILYSVARYLRDLVFAGSFTQLWYLKGLAVAVCITAVLVQRGVRPVRILAAAFILYMIGLFAQSWYGFIVPLRESAPFVWKVLKLVRMVISTTRNGVFDGFLFVAIGMCFAYCDISVSRRLSFILFAVSMGLLFAEVFILESNHYVRAHDMYLFLVPVAFFMFCAVRQVELSDSGIFKVLRVMSSLMFYTHLWISWVVTKAMKVAGVNTHDSCVRFLTVLVLTLAVSYLIYHLSGRDRFRWLKKLYT